MVVTKIPEVKVVFDTNAIYNQTGHFLFKFEIAELIKNTLPHQDISFSFILPDVVKQERHYQIEKQSLELLPSINKLEKLLGHKLGITDKTIIQHVNEAIQTQIQDFQISIINIDPPQVDWIRLISDATFRRPPFSTTEKEKGFRDSIICETLLKLIEDSPKSKTSCQIVFLCEDNLLIEAVQKRTSTCQNFKIVHTAKDLKDFINTLVSKVSQEYVNGILDKVTKYFFEPKNEDTLIFREKIIDRIYESHKAILNVDAREGEFVENDTTIVCFPSFLSKKKQRLTWSTQIIFNKKVFKYVFQEPIKETPTYVYNPNTSIQIPLPVLPTINQNLPLQQTQFSAPIVKPGILSSLWTDFAVNSKKEFIKKCKIIFEVDWSVTITSKGSLKSPKINGINFKNTEYVDDENL